MIKSLFGTYTLKKHGTYDRKGYYTPTSNYLKGELSYSSDGSISVLILFRETITSAKDILAYTGKFEVSSEDIIIHHISLCSIQIKNNRSEERKFSLNGSSLKLSVIEKDNSKFEAEWEKNLD